MENKHLQLLNILAESPRMSQRNLAHKMGISLGSVNQILRELIHSGYIRNSLKKGRKFKYLLTTKGFSEKSKNSYEYFSNTVRKYSEYKVRVHSLVSRLVHNGVQKFGILGHGDLTELIESSLQSLPQRVVFRKLATPDLADPDETLLDCRINFKGKSNGIVRVFSEIQKGSPN